MTNGNPEADALGSEPIIIPAPEQVPEVPPFPITSWAVQLGPENFDLANSYTMRHLVVAIALAIAAKHAAEVDADAIALCTSELLVNATYSLRVPEGIAVEWFDTIDSLPIQVEPEKADPEAVGYVAVRVADNTPVWQQDSRPDHDFGEPEAQEAHLVPIADASEHLGTADLDGSFSEEDISDVLAIAESAELKDGQTNRGLDLVHAIALAACHYVGEDRKTVVTLFPAHRRVNLNKVA